MADNSDIVEGLNGLDQTISTASDINSYDVNQLGERIEGAIEELGAGIKLTAKENAKDQEKKPSPYAERLQAIQAELEGLRNLSPELADVAETLIAINTELITSSEKTEERFTKDKEEKEKDADIKTDIKQASDLSGMTNLAAITGTGLALVGNMLADIGNQLAELKLGILEKTVGNSPEKQALVAAENPVTAATAEKESTKEGDSKGKLASFFQGLAGPLESVAGSMLILSIAIGILGLIEFDAGLVKTVSLLMGFMLFTFTALAAISIGYEKARKYFDVEGKEQGSITNIIKQFALMVAITAGTIIFSGIMVNIIKDMWPDVLMGLLVIFGVAFITLAGLTVLAIAMEDFLGNGDSSNSPIVQFVNAFAKMIAIVAILAIVCFFLHDIILQGMQYAFEILISTTLLMVGLGIALVVMAKAGVTDQMIEQFKSLMITTIVLIGVLALLTIVLGIIPQSIITQGLINVSLIVGLTIAIIGMLAISIKALQKVEEGKLWALMGILIVTTAMIAIIAILVIVLAQQDPAAMLLALSAMLIIAAIPIVLVKLMAKVGQSSAQLPQALLGTVVAALITVAVAAVAWLIISMLGSFTPAQVLVTVLAIAAISVLMIAMGGFTILMGAMWGAIIAGPQAALIPLAFIGVALAGTLAIAVAGIARLLAAILTPAIAQAAIIAAGAIMLTATALVVVGTATLALAAIALPLVFSSPLALIAIAVIGEVLNALALVITGPIVLASTMLQSIDPEIIKSAVTALSGIVKVFVTLSAVMLTFTIVAAGLVLSLTAVSLLMPFIATGVITITLSVLSMYAVLNLLPAGQDKSRFDSLKSAIKDLNSFSKELNKFVAPSLTKMFAVSVATKFVKKFVNGIKDLGNTEAIARVNGLANSLSTLANNASGMRDLAQAINEVSKATVELSEINTASQISVEALSGQSVSQTEMLERIQAKEPQQMPDNSKQFDEMIKVLGDLLEEMRGVKEAMSRVADNGYEANRYGTEPKTQFM